MADLGAYTRDGQTRRPVTPAERVQLVFAGWRPVGEAGPADESITETFIVPVSTITVEPQTAAQVKAAGKRAAEGDDGSLPPEDGAK